MTLPENAQLPGSVYRKNSTHRVGLGVRLMEPESFQNQWEQTLGLCGTRHEIDVRSCFRPQAALERLGADV